MFTVEHCDGGLQVGEPYSMPYGYGLFSHRFMLLEILPSCSIEKPAQTPKGRLQRDVIPRAA